MMISPLLGALLLLLARFNNNSLYVKFLPLFFSTATFLISIAIAAQFDHHIENFQFIEQLGSNVLLGIDGISLPLVLLTTLLFPLCIIYSLKLNLSYIKAYMALFLLLESLVIGFFISLNMIMFYILFEAVLMPMFLIIGIWGSKNRVYAAFKLFLYTFAGSLLFLVAVIYIYVTYSTSNIQELMSFLPKASFNVQKWLWLALFISFAVKIPMFPFHTWLPDAHVQAPTAGSVILAGLLIKMGAYGFLRFSLPMLPNASLYFANFVIALSIIAAIYASLVAFAQKDIKKLIAYSSIAHMGFVTAGIFSFNEEGISGAIFQMISHGIISAALFLCVGMLYSRTNTLNITKYGGAASTMPLFSLMFVLFSMAAIGLPTTSGFVSEFLCILGLFKSIKFAAALIATATILSAVYMLYLCKGVIWGVSTSSLLTKDISKIELFVLLPLAILTLLLGIYPTSLLMYLKPAISKLLTIIL
ncbi:NADH-quinone oxidoreductase subunit M [Candidatus Mesenet endosymbiont of Phosphuga atrata]|uniref:complex I subunit 4 family protein n=1 Tax=Candidatus Mesenet endosymbiont of Phosphuga atrata TaxID=3066221 RepID=UPI0030D10B0B